MKGMYAVSLFKGAATALINPSRTGKIDYVSMGKLIEWQIKPRHRRPCSLRHHRRGFDSLGHEKLQLVRFAVDLTDGRVPVIAGSGTNNTAAAADLSGDGRRRRRRSFLIVTPYYNRCTESGLISHYEK